MNSGSFSTGAFFWLVAGVLLGIAIASSLGGLWKNTYEKYGRLRGGLFVTAATCVLLAVAVSLYLLVGRPDLASVSPESAQVSAHANFPAGDRTPSSMEESTARLAARLTRDGGSDSDWNLLAQSYDFLGRSEEAARARNHLGAAASVAKSSAALEEAQTLRQARKFPEARIAYEKAIAESTMTADAWADYADVLASLANNQMTGAPARAIENALALNPNHPKALWLKASLAHEEHRYADAVVLWKRLRSLMADDSSDARIIDGNIAEAEQLATSDSNVTSGRVEVVGTIEIDPKLASIVAPGSTLFVYAKAVDSPGPPLAVFRTLAGNWPMQFTLDDSMAMIPGRNLSSASKVIVEARISRSGQATAASGDLQAVGANVNPRDGKKVRLRIDRQVG